VSLEHILLGCLKRPASGYDLKTYFDENIRQFWSAELSQIYPTLKRLETRGLLTSRTEPSAKGPARKVYSRTVDGREALLRWLTSGPQVGAERFAYLAQVFFMDELGDIEETRRFLLELRRRMAAWTATLQETERSIRNAAGRPPEEFSANGLHRFLTLRMGVHSVGAKVTWCDEAIRLLDARLGGATADGRAS
jgi:DNA-binding PadR family transcriptional regulator